ncbi:chromate transporter [Crassaminicella thermophila]|uniref:Chromate transporter n=1 Tax=Crassaminicella thermophila TaxID=2599308 RepID=A0A5C0SFD4_CRATE|nr:chromate transporter [Crassaminicella thermophila]QEK12890.1 chromate transporter [Crassaminicella thermophila]
MNKLIKMILVFIKIGTFTLGGGYAMIPLMQKEMVEKNEWIEDEEFIDIIALSQTIPGALAINTATYIGYRLFGLKGALLACLATMLPSVVIILIVAVFFVQFQNIELVESIFKGIRPAVVALILVAVMKLGKSLPKTIVNIFWVIGSVLCITLLHIHPILIIIFSGILGYKLYKGENVDESNS